MSRSEKFPHVPEWCFPVVDRFGSLLNNTGGNDPLDLLNDFLRRGTEDRPNRLMTTNVVRWSLAMGVYCQVILLRDLVDKGFL